MCTDASGILCSCGPLKTYSLNLCCTKRRKMPCLQWSTFQIARAFTAWLIRPTQHPVCPFRSTPAVWVKVTITSSTVFFGFSETGKEDSVVRVSQNSKARHACLPPAMLISSDASATAWSATNKPHLLSCYPREKELGTGNLCLGGHSSC